mmetsp:Transcript_30163/g.57928  ORF Transcript_30163/g.57928 Transcript_30163/m.57928 type:complete len:275 (-) Transcript_30163:167-991(-)
MGIHKHCVRFFDASVVESVLHQLLFELVERQIIQGVISVSVPICSHQLLVRGRVLHGAVQRLVVPILHLFIQKHFMDGGPDGRGVVLVVHCCRFTHQARQPGDVNVQTLQLRSKGSHLHFIVVHGDLAGRHLNGGCVHPRQAGAVAPLAKGLLEAGKQPLFEVGHELRVLQRHPPHFLFEVVHRAVPEVGGGGEPHRGVRGGGGHAPRLRLAPRGGSVPVHLFHQSGGCVGGERPRSAGGNIHRRLPRHLVRGVYLVPQSIQDAGQTSIVIHTV